MGLGHRWREVEKMYAEVNQLFGDIVKVTPSSKVVGDMTLFSCQEMHPADILKLDEKHDVSFPNSVVEMFPACSACRPADGRRSWQKISCAARLLFAVAQVKTRALGAKMLETGPHCLDDLNTSSEICPICEDVADRVSVLAHVPVISSMVFTWATAKRSLAAQDDFLQLLRPSAGRHAEHAGNISTTEFGK